MTVPVKPSLGPVAVAAKMALRMALTYVRDNGTVMSFLAQRLYEEETRGMDWVKLSAERRAIWLQRAHTVLAALAATTSP